MSWFRKSQRPIAPVTNPVPEPPAARTGVGATLRRWLRNDRPQPVAQGGPIEPLRVSQGGQPFQLTIAKPPALIEIDSDFESENVEPPAARVAGEMERGNLTDAQVIERLNALTRRGNNRVASFLPGDLRQSLATSQLSGAVLSAAEDLFKSCIQGSNWGLKSDCELVLDLVATVKFPDQRDKAELALRATRSHGGASSFRIASIVNVFKTGCFGKDAIARACTLVDDDSTRRFYYPLFANLILADVFSAPEFTAHFGDDTQYVRDFFDSDTWNGLLERKLEMGAEIPESALAWWDSPHGMGDMPEAELIAGLPPELVEKPAAPPKEQPHVPPTSDEI